MPIKQEVLPNCSEDDIDILSYLLGDNLPGKFVLMTSQAKERFRMYIFRDSRYSFFAHMLSDKKVTGHKEASSYLKKLCLENISWLTVDTRSTNSLPSWRARGLGSADVLLTSILKKSKDYCSLPSVSSSVSSLEVLSNLKSNLYDLMLLSNQQLLFDHFLQAYLSRELPGLTEMDMNILAFFLTEDAHNHVSLNENEMKEIKEKVWLNYSDFCVNFFDLGFQGSTFDGMNFIQKFFKFNLFRAIRMYCFSKNQAFEMGGLCYGLSVFFAITTLSGQRIFFDRMIALLYKYSLSYSVKGLISEDIECIDSCVDKIIQHQTQHSQKGRSIHEFASSLPEDVAYRTMHIDLSEFQMKVLLSQLEPIEGAIYLMTGSEHIIAFYFKDGNMWIFDQNTMFLFFRIYSKEMRAEETL